MQKWHSRLPANFRYEPSDKFTLSESARQRKMLVMVRRHFPDALIAHVPNGGKRNAREAAALKADGVMPGWPDLVITWDSGAAFCEVKDADGTCSENQKDVLSAMADQGHWCGVFRSDGALYQFLLDAGCPERVKWPHDFMGE